MDDLGKRVKVYLVRLSKGDVSASEAADWALQAMEESGEEFVEPKVWRALDQLSGADLLLEHGRYLHDPADFAEWLADFERDSDSQGLADH